MITRSDWNRRAGLALVLGGCLAGPAFAQTQSNQAEEEVSLERFEVTGSRIARLDVETPSPVTTINAERLQGMGFPTIADAVRALPMNNGQALTPTDSGTSFTPGVSSFNLRGLGNNGTLVLINGRRAVPYAAPGFDGFQTVFDLNSIPEGAIEAVDILKDGGSALYGSDAVAGVVNFRMKKDYQGAEATFQVGNYFDTDGLHKKVSAAFGSVNGNTSLFAAVTWEEQNAVFSRDLPYSSDADKTDIAWKANPRYEVEGLEASGYSSVEAYVADLGLTNPVDDGYFDGRSSRGFPGYIRHDFDGNGTISSAERFTFGSPTDNPTTAGATNGVNLYNHNETNGLFPETRRFSFYTRLQHDLTDHLYTFAELSFSRSEAEVHSAATPADIETSKGLNSGDPMYIPAENPYNPWGVDIFDGRRRMVENGNRISDITSDTPRLLAGLGGDFENTGGFFRDWTWEVAAMYTKNSVDEISRNVIPDYKLQEALLGLTRLGDGTLVWDNSTPAAERVYYNWFGVNEPAMAEFLNVENPGSSQLEYRSIDFRVGGPILELPAGDVGFSFGGERRMEEMQNIRSDLNATGNILGGSEGTSSFGERDLNALYAEFSIPLHRMVELQLAGRYEKYSDEGFDDDIRPKVALKFRPLDWLIFRASYAESFKAPDLAYLYTSSQTSFSSNQVVDPVTGTEIDQIQIVTAGNPDLAPETTDTYYVGFSLEPGGRLRGLDISVDYFVFKQQNLLAQLSDFYGYADFFTENANGNPLFAGKVVRDGATNEVLYIRDDYANISTAEYRGADFEVRYAWDTATLGRFAVGAAATWIDTYTIDDDEQVGGYLTAEWNGNVNFNWDYQDWELSLFGVYRGERDRALSFGNIYTDEDTLYLAYTVKPQYTLNAAVSYSGFRKTRITVGVNNVFDDDPPVDPYDPLGTTPGVNDAQPAFWYVRLAREF